MTTKSLEYFLVVVKHLNISHAAKELYISQPALSKQISLLEQELGVRLFERTKQMLKLTCAGEVLVKEANELFQKKEELIRHVRRAGSMGDNTLVIHYMTGSLNTELPDRIAGFRREFPQVQMTLENSIPNLIFPDLVSGKVNAGFLLSATTVCPPALQMRSLSSSQLYVAVHQSHPYARMDEISFQDIEGQKMVMLDSLDAPFQHSLLPFFLHGKQQERQNQMIIVKSMEQVVALTRAGIGISFIAKDYCQNDLESLRLIPIRDAVPIHLCVIWNPERMTDYLEAFLRQL